MAQPTETLNQNFQADTLMTLNCRWKVVDKGHNTFFMYIAYIVNVWSTF